VKTKWNLIFWGEGMKILIIEDNLAIRDEIAALLRYEEHEVLESGDGLEGLKLAGQEAPELIFCDIVLPGIDGFILLENLRKNPETEKIPLIFLTALPSSEFIKNISEYEFTGYLRKPFDSEEVLQIINRFKQSLPLIV
jgi:CheY-like chemotaxis protein